MDEIKTTFIEHDDTYTIEEYERDQKIVKYQFIAIILLLPFIIAAIPFIIGFALLGGLMGWNVFENFTGMFK